VIRRHPSASRLAGRASRVRAALVTAPAAALRLVLAASPAGAGEVLSEQHGCSNCHLVDKKLVGPAYKEVAAKYAGQKDAAAKLAETIQKGGVGAWGQVPMPANPQVSADEAKTLAAWVLTIK